MGFEYRLVIFYMFGLICILFIFNIMYRSIVGFEKLFVGMLIFVFYGEVVKCFWDSFGVV